MQKLSGMSNEKSKQLLSLPKRRQFTISVCYSTGINLDINQSYGFPPVTLRHRKIIIMVDIYLCMS